MGKASTYAFLQAMRTEIGVSHLAGSDCAKAFTEEPGRHVIPESKLEQIEGEIPCGLPDGIIAIPLAGCFFTGVSESSTLGIPFIVPPKQATNSLCLLFRLQASLR